MHDRHRTDGRNDWIDSALALGMIGLWVLLLVGMCTAVVYVWPR